MSLYIPIPVIPVIDDLYPTQKQTRTPDPVGPEFVFPEDHHPVEFPSSLTVRIEEPRIPFHNAANSGAPEYVRTWADYVGQEPLKEQLMVFIKDARERMEPLPHTLLASGMPGVGKTTLARLIAKEMHSHLVMLVPPFSPETLYEAAMSVPDGGVLFIDEIHKLADNGPRAAENLLHLMEEGVLYLEDGIHKLFPFTLCGATTDADKLPEPIIDRFVIKPYFQAYTLRELVRIADNFCRYYEVKLRPDTLAAIARACRGTPRIARELVVGARALQSANGRKCTPQELLAFKELEPDGTTRQHKAYLLALFQFFGREIIVGDQREWEYVAGEMSLLNILRENKPGLARLERFLIERGLVDRTPRGRRLTPRGIARAQEFLARGEGLNSG